MFHRSSMLRTPSLRIGLFVWLLSVALPTFAAQAGWSTVPFAPRAAHAQDQVTALARERFLEGVAAYDAGNYEEARTAFLQAYALKRHPAVLLNLGQSELRAGHTEDGAMHLHEFLHEHAGATDEQKTAANQGIAEARKTTGFAVVIVNVDDANITVSGKPIGKSPLLWPVYVQPGKHTVTATKDGITEHADFEARKGLATPVALSFAAAPAPAPVIAPAGPPAQAAPPAMQPQPPTGMAMTFPPPGSGEDRRRDRRDPIEWFKRRPLAWVGVGLTGLGIIGSVSFGVAAANASARADEVSDQILNEVQRNDADPATGSGDLPAGYRNPATGEPAPCGDRDDPTSSYPYYRSACDTLRDNLDIYDTDVALMVTSVVVGTVAAGATVAYYFIDTADDDGNSRSSWMIAPMIGENERGLGLVGTF
jgi:hypothetical protein